MKVHFLLWEIYCAHFEAGRNTTVLLFTSNKTVLQEVEEFPIIIDQAGQSC